MFKYGDYAELIKDEKLVPQNATHESLKAGDIVRVVDDNHANIVYCEHDNKRGLLREENLKPITVKELLERELQKRDVDYKDGYKFRDTGEYDDVYKIHKDPDGGYDYVLTVYNESVYFYKQDIDTFIAVLLHIKETQ